MAIALIDMDGTLCDYDGAMKRDLDSLRSPNEPETEIRWGTTVSPWIRARRLLIRSRPGWWADLEPLPLGMEILEKLKEMDFETHVLTKGPFNSTNAWTEKIQWCKKHLDPATPVTITMDKGLVYGRVLVDDYAPYVMSWLEWRPRGLAIVPAHPWNEGIESMSNNIIRVQSFNDPRLIPALSAAASEKGIVDGILR